MSQILWLKGGVEGGGEEEELITVTNNQYVLTKF
jgi:hypothetical protein